MRKAAVKCFGNQNKERWLVFMAAVVDEKKCTGCGTCLEECPIGAIALVIDKALISDECTECGACVEVCPEEAISL
jgi:ferredoxin